MRHVSLRSLGLLLSGVLSSVAAAADAPSLEERMTADEFRETGLDTLTPAQRAALDAWLERKGCSATSAATALAAPSDNGATAAPIADTRGLRPTALDEESDITSRVLGRFTGWESGAVFELENGQVWRSVDGGSSLRGVNLRDPRVTIRKGLMGGWRLKVEGYNASVRVERVR